MKVLLDENIDVRFRDSFKETSLEVFTVKYMGWSGVKNGQLLQLMKEHEFGVFICVDKNLPYQQNQDDLPVTIIVLDVFRNVLASLAPYTSLILETTDNNPPKKVIILKIQIQAIMPAAKDTIQIDPEILGGEPVFRGTRVAIQTLFDHLETSSLEEFLAGYPSVSRQQAGAVIELAGNLVNTLVRQSEGVA